MNMELRVLDAELTSKDDGTMTVSGYVNKTEQFSNVLGMTKKFVEKIAKGAFTRAIQNSKRDIDFLAEHQKEKILSSTRNDSLILREDDEGLFMEATITPTSWGKDTYTLINSQIYKNMSFGFRTIKDSWKPTASGVHERTIEELELFEVSVVKDPAYSQSTIAARGIDLIEDVQIPDELEKEKIDMTQFEEVLEKVSEIATKIDEQRSQEKREDVDLEALANLIVGKLQEVIKQDNEDLRKDPEEDKEKKEDPEDKPEGKSSEKLSEDSKDKEKEDDKDPEDKSSEKKDEEKKEDEKRGQADSPDFTELRALLNSLK